MAITPRILERFMDSEFWNVKKMQDLSEEEWESLCDGCGVCCMEKLRNDQDEIFYTCVACGLFDVQSCRCKDYQNRSTIETGCLRINLDDLKILRWLPATCAYRRLHEVKKLPDWHYLVCKDREAVHKAGLSARRPTLDLKMSDNLDSVIVGEIHEKIDGTFFKKIVLQTKKIRFMDWLEKMEE